MLEVIFLLALGLIWIIFATCQDLKEGEVANWLNFSLVIFALGFRFFFSLFTQNSFSFFYQGLIGFGIFFLLGQLFYYSRIFGGGDAKLMFAMGAILPFSDSFRVNLQSYLTFLLLFFIVGTIYGLVWSFTLVVRNRKPFVKQFVKILKKNKNKVSLFMFFALILMVLGFFQEGLFYLGLLFFISPYFFIYAKAIDEAAMIEKINVKDLREGDWLYRDVKVGKKYVKADWEGASKKEIAEIRKKHKMVSVRRGIVFVPVFLISFLIISYGILRGISIFSSFF